MSFTEISKGVLQTDGAAPLLELVAIYDSQMMGGGSLKISCFSIILCVFHLDEALQSKHMLGGVGKLHYIAQS